MEQRYCILDYETRSEVNLKKCGGFEYANHQSTQVLCASWRVGTKAELREQVVSKMAWDDLHPQPRVEPNPFAAQIWSPAFDKPTKISGLLACLTNPEIQVVAHNAFFEQAITRFVLSRYPWAHPRVEDLPHDRWICTASMAAALALPRNLENACLALNLPIKKDMDGNRLIKKYCKPRKASKNNQAKYHNLARDLKRIMLYCQNDVDAETLLFLAIPELNETERKMWLLDQKINFRGFEVDRKLVSKTLRMISEETKTLNERTKDLTDGAVYSTTQRDAVKDWLESQEMFLPDLQAKTVKDALAANLVKGPAKEILEIRQAVSMTSTKKYHAFEMRSRTDGRLRDMLMYHGASTGRWSGVGVQPQNFPRGNIKDTDFATEVVGDGDLEWVRCLYGHPMNVFSSCLRGMIKASEDKELFCGDYAAIEARVLFWVADHIQGLQAFKDNRPLYEEMAVAIYNVVIGAVTWLQRDIGKRAVLGCGFGMGWKKFKLTCEKFGVIIDDDLAQTAVSAYRSMHKPVTKLWSNLEKVAVAAIQNPGKKLRINHTTWWVKDRFLWCELPSGRRLAYFGPEVRYESTPWDEKRPVIYHWGVDQYTRKWTLAKTYGGKLCENVVQAIARDLMAAAMLRCEDVGYELLLTVHDELLTERRKDQGDLDEFKNLMAEVPEWGIGLPVKVEAWKGPRYHK
jgi:DNA polymerase